MYFLLNTGIFHPAMLVYQRVCFWPMIINRFVAGGNIIYTYRNSDGEGDSPSSQTVDFLLKVTDRDAALRH